MKLPRLGTVGAEPAGGRRGRSQLRPERDHPDTTGIFLANGGPQQAEAALAAGHPPEIPNADALRVGAPMARPGVVVCVGLNYAAHAAESNVAPPEHPVIFFKPPNTVVGPHDQVAIPRNSVKTDWEVELGVVIGQVTSYLTRWTRAAITSPGTCSPTTSRSGHLAQFRSEIQHVLSSTSRTSQLGLHLDDSSGEASQTGREVMCEIVDLGEVKQPFPPATQVGKLLL